MTYTVERLCSCVGENRQKRFRLTYEVSYVQELDVWKSFLVKKEELPAAGGHSLSESVFPRIQPIRNTHTN